MKNIFKDKVDTSFLVIVLVISFLFFIYTLLNNNTAVPTGGIDQIITYHRSVGGEDIKVETVKLSCFVGPSKGVINGEIWCNEIVVNQWSETDKNN